MRCSIILAATLVSTALAAPSLHRAHAAAHLVARAYVYDVKTVTETVYVTEGGPTSTKKVTTHTTSTVYTPPPPPPPPSSTYTPPPPPPVTTSAPPVVAAPKIVAPEPSPTPEPTTSIYVAPTPTPTPTPSPAPAPALSGTDAILATCNKYRDLYGLPHFSWSSKIAANAAKTGQDNGGVTENHELLDGSFGQVITPGLNSAVSGVNLQGFSPFELAYLSWMCEASSDPEISAACAKEQSTMNMMYSSRGHYDILTSTSYTQIGCAFTQNPNAGSSSPYQGLWVCDVAF